MHTQTLRGTGWTGEGARIGSATGPASEATQHQHRGRNGQHAANGDGLNSRTVGLGLFSLGLGLAQVTAAPQLSRLLLGANNKRNRGALRAVGVREIGAGLGLLARRRPAGWLWARLAGDVMDLGLLALAFSSKKARARNVSAAAAGVLGVAVIDFLAARRQSRLSAGAQTTAQPSRISASVTIARPVDEVYRFWRNLPNLPRFMAHLESIDQGSDGRWHWRGRGPGGQTFEWDAELLIDRPNESIAWESIGDAPLPNSGQVRFSPAPGGRGTEVTLVTEYRPAGGKLGASIAHMFAKVPEVQMQNDLRRCKQLLELGEVVHSDASIARGMHPARPGARQGGAR
jgi:uncharacterized membrane protein